MSTTAAVNPTPVAPSTTAAPAPFASASLYVGDLAHEVTEAVLFEIFNAVGPVSSVRVCRDAATRRSLGYAYVNFHRADDAERALDTMNFTNIRTRPCRIMWSHRDPSLRRSGAGNIFIKNLAKVIDNKTLFDTFSMFGNILSCKVATNDKEESLGYGFVHYESEESAQKAIKNVDGKMIAEQLVTVAPFKSKRDRGGIDKQHYTNVYVKNLPDEVDSDEKLVNLFRPFGEISSSYLSTQDGKSRGFGFVNFHNNDDASRAVEALHDKEHGDKKLFVCRAQKKSEREKELRARFEAVKLERQKKYQGVNLYVKNLSDQVDDDRLREEFSKFGEISSAHIMKDTTDKKKSRGFGFVCFVSPEEATKAVTEMNGKMLDNKPLYVALAQRKEVRRAQLEAHYAARAKGMTPMPMYPPQTMFYNPTGVMPPRMMFTQQMAAMGGPRWQGGPRQNQRPQMIPPMGYNVMGGGAPMRTMPGPQGPAGQAQGQVQGQGPRGRGAGQRNGNAGQVNMNAAPAGGKQRRAQGQPGPVPTGVQQPLTIAALAAAPENQQKQLIGERLFPLIHSQEPVLAGKITGMLLEMDNSELLHLLESAEARGEKIEEAKAVLQQHTEHDASAEEGTTD